MTPRRCYETKYIYYTFLAKGLPKKELKNCQVGPEIALKKLFRCVSATKSRVEKLTVFILFSQWTAIFKKPTYHFSKVKTYYMQKSLSK